MENINGSKTKIIIKDNNNSIKVGRERRQSQKKNVSCHVQVEDQRPGSRKATHYKRIGSLKRLNAYKRQVTTEEASLCLSQQGKQKFESEEKKSCEKSQKIKRIGTLKKILAAIYDDTKQRQKRKSVQQKNNPKAENNGNLEEMKIINEVSDSVASEKKDDSEKDNENSYQIIISAPQNEKKFESQDQADENQNLQNTKEQSKSRLSDEDQDQVYESKPRFTCELPYEEKQQENESLVINCLLNLPQINELFLQDEKTEGRGQKNEHVSKVSQISASSSIHAETCPQRDLSTSTIRTNQEEEEKISLKKNSIVNGNKVFTLKKKKFEERKNSEPFLAPKRLNSNINIKNKNMMNKKNDNLLKIPNNKPNVSIEINPYGQKSNSQLLDFGGSEEKENQNKQKNFKKKRLENASIHSYIAEAKKQINYRK